MEVDELQIEHFGAFDRLRFRDNHYENKEKVSLRDSLLGTM